MISIAKPRPIVYVELHRSMLKVTVLNLPHKASTNQSKAGTVNHEVSPLSPGSFGHLDVESFSTRGMSSRSPHIDTRSLHTENKGPPYRRPPCPHWKVMKTLSALAHQYKGRNSPISQSSQAQGLNLTRMHYNVYSGLGCDMIFHELRGWDGVYHGY